MFFSACLCINVVVQDWNCFQLTVLSVEKALDITELPITLDYAYQIVLIRKEGFTSRSIFITYSIRDSEE